MSFGASSRGFSASFPISLSSAYVTYGGCEKECQPWHKKQECKAKCANGDDVLRGGRSSLLMQIGVTMNSGFICFIFYIALFSLV